MEENFFGLDIKKLGFGLMRLPKIGAEEDIEQTKKMVDTFIGKGFKYFDTAYVYDGGKSEKALKKARENNLSLTEYVTYCVMNFSDKNHG